MPKSLESSSPTSTGALAGGMESTGGGSATMTAPEPRQRPTLPPGEKWWWGTGRRKTAVARVRIRPGGGTFHVNEREAEKYFSEERDRNDIRTVLEKTNTLGALEIHAQVHGGGFMGQAGAIVLGLGRALKKYDPSLEGILRDNGFLTRDSREVERKKSGQKGARGRFQFSKR
jgi:small subunit ribosomal protein S9